MKLIKSAIVPILVAAALGLSAWNAWTGRKTEPTPEPAPAPLVEPTDADPLIVPAQIDVPATGFAKLPIKFLGKLRIVEYPETAGKFVQVELIAGEPWVSRLSAGPDIYIGLQTEHKSTVSPVRWVRMGLGSKPPPVDPVKPPEPKPEPKPSAPIPAPGFRVLVVYETADKLTKSQISELNGGELADYLNAKCAKVDGQPEWRVWDQHVTLAGASQLWRDAMARPRTSLPWVVISDGVTGFEGPIPAGGELLPLVRKFGG